MVDLATFQEWVDALDDEIESAAFDAASGGFYGFDPERFADVTLDTESTATAEGLFQKALALDRDDDPYFVTDRLLQNALPILAKGLSTTPLDHLGVLVRDWSTHARVLSLYLRSFIGSPKESTMIHSVETELGRASLVNSWVRGWLIDPLARSTGPLRPRTVRRLGRISRDVKSPWFVRTRAVIALAQRDELPTQETLSDLFEAAPPSARADLIAATFVGDAAWRGNAKKGWSGSSPILRAVFEMFEQSAEDEWAEFL